MSSTTQGRRILLIDPDQQARSAIAEILEHAGYTVDVLDPVGAGDAFVAGLLGSIFLKHTLLGFLALSPERRRGEVQKALEIGNVCGALTCTRQGDTAAMPTMDEVREFVAGHPVAG